MNVHFTPQRALLCSLHSVLSLPLATEDTLHLVAGLLGEEGLLPRLALQPGSRLQPQTVGLVRELLSSKSVVILQEVYSLLCMRLEQSLVSLVPTSPTFLPAHHWTGATLPTHTATATAVWVQVCCSIR